MNFRKIKAFTLVELLVIIVIIGILATLIVVSLKSSRTRAREVRRKSDFDSIRTALEFYKDATGAYPSSNDTICRQPWWTPWCCSAYGINWIPGLAPTYIPVVPIDPTNSSGADWENNYFYSSFPYINPRLIFLFPIPFPCSCYQS